MVKVRLIQKDKEPNCGDPDNCCGYFYYQSGDEVVEMTDEQYAEFQTAMEDKYPTDNMDSDDFPFISLFMIDCFMDYEVL